MAWTPTVAKAGEPEAGVSPNAAAMAGGTDCACPPTASGGVDDNRDGAGPLGSRTPTAATGRVPAPEDFSE